LDFHIEELGKVDLDLFTPISLP